ncbi:MAG TPA: hypothetical protein VIQ74_07680 [Gemmatimonadaceae bacterium]
MCWIAALTALFAQMVAIGLSPIAEARASTDVPTHIEAADRAPHPGHHPADCAFCIVRHLSPLPVRPFTGARPAVVRQSLRPVAPHQAFVAVSRDPDPARAPPLL